MYLQFYNINIYIYIVILPFTLLQVNQLHSLVKPFFLKALAQGSLAIAGDRSHQSFLVDVAVRDLWNAVVSLCENRKRAIPVDRELGATICFPEVGNQLQFWVQFNSRTSSPTVVA
jgi:hypothetical protein